MSNYFISYDLNVPGKDYEGVIKAIQSFGTWAKVHKSLWYVSSPLTLKDVYAVIEPAFDASDRFMVIEATSAHWNTLSQEVGDYIKSNWGG